MTGGDLDLDVFSVGAWTLFDHLLRLDRLPREGETLPLDMPIRELDRVHFGDCSANIAAVAAGLGLRTGLGMVVGEDFVPSGYRDHLTMLGVDLTGVDVRQGQRSGHSYNVFDAQGRGFCLSHLGVAAKQDDWRPPLAQIDRSRAVVVSEMFSPYPLRVIEHAKRQGKLTAINGMIATADALTNRFLAAADVLFLSRGEAAELLDARGLQGPQDLHAHGPRLVVVTRGVEGSIWYTAEGAEQIGAVPAERVVDSTGAGDAFVAGALYGMVKGLGQPELGRWAATVASFVVEAWGCQTNLPTADEVRGRYQSHFGEEFAG